jgi:hypothetical protein
LVEIHAQGNNAENMKGFIMDGSLLPCPFCGMEEIIQENEMAFCSNCGATNALIRWNHRSPGEPGRMNINQQANGEICSDCKAVASIKHYGFCKLHLRVYP